MQKHSKEIDELILRFDMTRMFFAEEEEEEEEPSIVVSLTDITDRKRAEEALRESEERYRSVFENTGTATIIIEEDTTISMANTEYERLTGYRKKEIEGNMSWTEHVAKEDVERMKAYHYERRKKGGKAPNQYECRFVDRQGNIKNMLSKVGMIPGTKRSVASLMDITSRKEMEEELRSERDKLKAIFAALGEGVSIVNRNFIIEYQNEVLKERFGDRIGDNCYAAYMKLAAPCGFCPMHKVIETREIEHIEVDAADGRSYEESFSSFIDVDSEIKLIKLAKDVTEKKILQAEAMRAGHLAALGELAAGVAHEINNPINGIINYAQILLDEREKQDEEAEVQQRIIKEAERIAEIVKNLLSFARERKEEHGPVIVQDIIRDSLGLVERQILKDGIRLKVDVPDDLPKIKALSQQIQQVFLNILSNARYALNRKFYEPHEQKVLEIRAGVIEIEGRKYVRTTFYDQGTGIPKRILDKICNPFFSTKPKGEGTGLGLSISHGIIKNHRGRLWFDSREGEHTKVMVDLPVDDG